LLVLSIVVLGMLALGLLLLIRMAWRLYRGDEPMEPGGSYGRQFFGRKDR
jgi:hypothetical protein